MTVKKIAQLKYLLYIAYFHHCCQSMAPDSSAKGMPDQKRAMKDAFRKLQILTKCYIK